MPEKGLAIWVGCMAEGTITSFSKDDLLKLTELTKKFGELIVGIGEMEEKVGSFDLLLKEFKDISFWQTMASKLEKYPKFSAKFGVLLAKIISLYPTMQKKFSELSPSEKVSLGRSIIEISELMEEIIQEGE